MRLIAQIHSYDSGVIQITAGQGLPVGNPCCFAIGAGIPEAVFRAASRIGTVVIQDQMQSNLPGISDYLIQNLKRIKTLQISINGAAAIGEGDVLRNNRMLYHLV